MGRGISAIKVTEEPSRTPARFEIEWLDEAGAPHTRVYYARTAQSLSEELAVQTAVSEAARESYLRGVARGITIRARD